MKSAKRMAQINVCPSQKWRAVCYQFGIRISEFGIIGRTLSAPEYINSQFAMRNAQLSGGLCPHLIISIRYCYELRFTNNFILSVVLFGIC